MPEPPPGPFPASVPEPAPEPPPIETPENKMASGAAISSAAQLKEVGRNSRGLLARASAARSRAIGERPGGPASGARWRGGGDSAASLRSNRCVPRRQHASWGPPPTRAPVGKPPDRSIGEQQ